MALKSNHTFNNDNFTPVQYNSVNKFFTLLHYQH